MFSQAVERLIQLATDASEICAARKTDTVLVKHRFNPGTNFQSFSLNNISSSDLYNLKMVCKKSSIMFDVKITTIVISGEFKFQYKMYGHGFYLDFVSFDFKRSSSKLRNLKTTYDKYKII